MVKLFFLPGLISFVISSCTNNTSQTVYKDPLKNLTYLALGDSYTIGEAVSQQESFPFQLRDALSQRKILLDTPVVIAQTGWTTGDLTEAIEAANPSKDFDLVTLLVGVNNQYRGYSAEAYRKEFKILLEKSVAFARSDKSHVYVVSIPDWGVTPFGKNSGKVISEITAQIDLFNKINKEETAKMGVSYTDITILSRKADTDLELIAEDGLHPSGKMYKDWVEQLMLNIQAN